MCACPSTLPAETLRHSLRRFYAFDDTIFELAVHEPQQLTEHVPEAFVQDLWAFQRLNASRLRTSDGAPVEVLEPGTRNTDGGPDFRQARLRIGGVVWVGDVEVHTTSGTWFDHQHHLDPRYNSVVLHVALIPDPWTGGLLRADGVPIPEVTLYPCLDAPVRTLLHDFHTRRDEALPCAAGWSRVPASLRTTWIDRLGRERMLEKADRLAEAYLHTPDVDALLHRALFTALGYAKNAEPMQELARRVPLPLARQIQDPRDLEAVHAGVAGLLPAASDLLDSDRESSDYVMELRERFDRLQHRFDLRPMPAVMWQFFRLRPANFPPLRIAQAASLVQPGQVLHRDPLGRLLEALHAEDPLRALRTLLRGAPDPFWQTHVRYERPTSSPHTATIGRSRIDQLIVNAILPVLLVAADAHPEIDPEQLVQLTRRLSAASDHITRRFEALGTRPADALAVQGLHQLYRTRCSEVRCLTCAIGQHLLGRSVHA